MAAMSDVTPEGGQEADIIMSQVLVDMTREVDDMQKAIDGEQVY